MESGAARVSRIDAERDGAPRALLFVDADLGATALNDRGARRRPCSPGTPT